MFNIYSQVREEIESFKNDTIKIAGEFTNKGAKYLKSTTGGYIFNQAKMLDLIDLYYNSKFESGETDSEGQRKTFLNICKFRQKVAEKQTDIDVKDFLFIPEDGQSDWGPYFMTKRFRQWAKEQGFGKVINQLNSDYSRYGTCVAKRVGDEIERVPIKNLINPQDAECLEDAEYVIEVHKDMTLHEIQEVKEWDTSKLDLNFGDKITVYERYGFVPVSFLKEYKGEEVEEGDEKKVVDCLTILTFDASKKDGDEQKRGILFIEELAEDDRPYEEAHWDRQDGRWLGTGEIENQMENQIMRNTIANLRRRALMWGSKKIFQSRDAEVAKNLVKEVRDGDVLTIGPTGEISQVNMGTQALPDMGALEAVYDRNSDQISFTPEIATGETMPSGTPFRLGVQLAQAVNSHYNLKRENFGFFLENIVMNQLLKIFKKDNKKEHTMNIFLDEEGAEALKTEAIKIHTNTMAKEQLLAGILPDLKAIEEKVKAEYNKRKSLAADIPDNFYDDVRASLTLVITGENYDVQKNIETLTNLYTVMSQQGDPRAEKVLARILSLTGANYDLLAGPKPQPQQIPQMPQMQPQMEAAGQGQSLPESAPVMV